MKQNPSKLKFKKLHKINFVYSKIQDNKTFMLNFGLLGIQALQYGRLTYKQIEACRRTIRRGLKKTGNIWINVFTYVPITKKPIASRMGKGKGNISHWVAPIRRGQVSYEINSFETVRTHNILKKVISRLPFKSKIISPRY